MMSWAKSGFLGLCILAMAGAAQATGNVTFGGVSAIASPGSSTPPSSLAQVPASSGQEWAPAPNVSRAIMPPATFAEWQAASQSRTLPSNLNQGATVAASPAKMTTMAVRVGGDTAATGPASIAELARALHNNPDLIYQYVRNNIEFYPVWGTQKGPVGTIQDNQGTAFDQASLMVALLRASGYTTNYVFGWITLSAQQVHDWYGIDTSQVCGVINLLAQAQIPINNISASQAGSCPGLNASLTGMTIGHVWVKVTINGTDYNFDPSYKSHFIQNGINLTTASGYNAANYLSSARTGATITADYVQGLNRNGIRSNLTSYANSLEAYFRTNYPTGSLDNVLGGKTISPDTTIVRQTAGLPYQAAGSPTLVQADIPATYKPTLEIQYQGIDQTYTSDAIYGRRLTITYNSSSQPVLMLDGTVVATGTATTPGTLGNITFKITHNAYTSTSANQTVTQRIKAGGTFVIANGWGPAGRGLSENYRTQLDGFRAAGAADSSESVLGSSLSLLAAQWLTQYTQTGYITEHLANTTLLSHHQVGIAGYTNAAYVDLAANEASIISPVVNSVAEDASFTTFVGHLSILESTTVQQVTGTSAVSTVKLLDIAAAANQKIYSATSANYTSAVLPNLTACSSQLANFQAYINAGIRLIVPSSCNITENNWSGVGYFTMTTTNIGAVISNGLSGGFPTLDQLASSFTLNSDLNVTLTSPTFNLQLPGPTFGDPIDMVHGNYVYSHEDMNVGQGKFPLGLSFQRFYSSGLRTQDGPVGKGWTNNLNATVTVGSDGLQAMGEDSALDAAPALAEMAATYDLLTDSTRPTDKILIAALGERWFGDQLINNTVTFRQGVNGQVFVKLTDGSYNPPPGVNARLILNADGTYTYETVNRTRLNFDSTGKITSYNDPNGVQVKYTYTGNLLSQVQNSLGRTLTITNTSGRVTQVSDGTRTVSYTYDSSGNLSAFTDAAANKTTFNYDQPGRMTKVFYPSFPTTAFATNTYDTLGRIQTQTNAVGGLYTYYFAGSRSEEVGPGGVSRVSYLDALGQVLQSVNPLGAVTNYYYDNLSRPAVTSMPEGNYIVYSYDDASCASADKRCTNNIKTLSYMPKPGSSLPTTVKSFTYEGAFNQVATATDANGQVTQYTYTAQGLPSTITAPADSSGVQPLSTFTYTAYSPSGYPTFYLPTSETIKTSATNSVTNTKVYSASSNYLPTTKTDDAGTGKLNLVTTFQYFPTGDIKAVLGPRTDVAQETLFTYDNERRVTAINPNVANLQQVERRAYDADGRPISVATELGSQWMVTCNTYTPSGKILKSWGPGLTNGATTCPVAAPPVSVTDYAYDLLDRQTSVTQNLASTEGGNRVTTTAYNADDSIQSINRAVGTALAQTYATYTYTPNGLVATIKDAKGNLTTNVYDGQDRLMQTRYPSPGIAGVSSTTDFEQLTYDNNNNVTADRKRNGASVVQTYDNLNRLIARTYPGSTTTAAWSTTFPSAPSSSNPNPVGITSSNTGLFNWVSAGVEAIHTHNAAGTVQDDMFRQTQYLKTQSVTTSLTYNSGTTVGGTGRYITLVDRSTGAWGSSSSQIGVRFQGSKLYILCLNPGSGCSNVPAPIAVADNTNYVIQVTTGPTTNSVLVYPQGAAPSSGLIYNVPTTFNWDGDSTGRKRYFLFETYSNTVDNISYLYAVSEALVTAGGNSGDSVSYSYDLRGLRTGSMYTDTSHVISYGWDNAGRLLNTTADGKTLSYQYDAAGNQTQITWPDVTPFYVTTSYDVLNRPTAIKENGSVTLATYTYDDLSRRTNIALGNGNTTQYSYTPQSSLLSLSHFLGGTGQDVAYTYTRNQAQEITGDSWTNSLYQWTGYTNGTKSYTSNGLNQYTAVAGATPTYDANGNLTSDGVWTYGYDLDNRLRTGSTTGQAMTLSYDPEGRLQQSNLAGTATNLLYDGTKLIAEYDSANNLLRRYVHGPGTDEPLVWYEGAGTTSKNWLFADHQGSIIATTNSTGNSTATYTYGPFGEPNTAAGIRFRYTGQQMVGNLYYYKARFYSPSLGRFLQTDPVGTKDDLNTYSYVKNDSINNTDPTGQYLYPQHLIFGAIGAMEAGKNPLSAIWFGAQAGWVDFRSGAQGADATTSAIHAMAGLDPQTLTSVSPYQAADLFVKNLSNAIGEGDFSMASHDVTDFTAAGHRNFAEWDGGATFLHLPSFSHFLGDMFPSWTAAKDAISNTEQVSEMDRNGVGDGFMHLQNGDGGLMFLNVKSGLWINTDSSGKQMSNLK